MEEKANKNTSEKAKDRSSVTELTKSPMEIHCPFRVCKESSNPSVPFGKFISHLTNDHRVTSAPRGESVFVREMYIGQGNMFRFKRDGPKIPFLMNCYNNVQFIQHSFCAEGNFWFWISVMGSQRDADKFQTNLTVYHPSIKNRKMSWEGIVHSVNTSADDVYNSEGCLVMPKSVLDEFMDIEGGKMLWNLKIEIMLKEDIQESDLCVGGDEFSNNIPKENSPPKKRTTKGKRKTSKPHQLSE